MTKADNTREIECIAIANWIDLVGVADLKNLGGVLQKEKCNEWLERTKNPVPSYCWERVLACPKGGKRPRMKGWFRLQARGALLLESSV
jgi:hypothetical protein